MGDSIKPKDKGYLRGEEIDIAVNNVFSKLDKIDLKSYLEQFKGRKAYELMKKLENDFPYEDDYSHSLLDAVNEDEFVDYLNKRYGLKIKESTVTYYYL